MAIMGIWGLAVATSNVFTIYPGFIAPDYHILAATDKGPVLELIVGCKPGEGIMTYSKIDRKYCIADNSCYTSLKPAIRKLCQ